MRSTPETSLVGPSNRAVAEAAQRVYDAEVALHIARQAGVDQWITAAYDRLHEALIKHTAARRAAGTWPVAS
jgi:hypothetical protein